MEEEELCPLRAIGCVGSSSRVGEHLAHAAELWRAGSELSAVQLHKAGMGAEERAEVLEQLFALAQRHSL